MELGTQDDSDKERTRIRQELANLSFVELQKLKEKLGTKTYNEAMFGTSSTCREQFKRKNKNRPREMSSKKPVPVFREVVPVKKNASRDPRFDGLCGDFDEKAFKARYGFVSEFKAKEVKTLKDELLNTSDNEHKAKLKYLIQRMENQLKEEDRRKKKEHTVKQEKEALLQALKEGKKPFFRKKSEKRIAELLDQFEDLKKKGTVVKNIEKHRKKMAQKNRKLLPS